MPISVRHDDPNTVELGEGWSITRLTDESGHYYRVDGPEGESQTCEDLPQSFRLHRRRKAVTTA